MNKYFFTINISPTFSIILDGFFSFTELVAVCYGILSEGYMYVVSRVFWVVIYLSKSKEHIWLQFSIPKAGLNNLCLPIFYIERRIRQKSNSTPLIIQFEMSFVFVAESSNEFNTEFLIFKVKVKLLCCHSS